MSPRPAFVFESLEQRQLLAADCFSAAAPEEADASSQAAFAPAVSGQSDTAAPVVDTSEQVAIALPSDLPEEFRTTVTYQGAAYELWLSKNSVFGENTRFLLDDGSGNLAEVDPGVERAYIGSVVGEIGSSVTAVLTEDGLLATINRLDEPAIIVEPLSFSTGVEGAAVAASGGGLTHRVFTQEAITIDYLAHDHDGDGIPDHAAADHVDETGGGHPPGCSCAACSAAASDDPAAVPVAAFDPLSQDLASSGTQQPTIAAATLPPDRVLDVLEFEVGVEIGSAALLNNYSGSTIAQRVASAMAVVQGIPSNLDSRFLHAAGIKHRLGTVIIRTGEPGNTDPFTVSNGNDSPGLTAFSNYWNNLQANEGIAPTHDLAVYHVRGAPSGLATFNSSVGTVGTGGRYALSASNGPTSWADGTLAHEFGHTWSLPHVNQGRSAGLFYENRPRINSGANTAGGRDSFISPMDGRGEHNIGRFATDEANQLFEVREFRRQFGDLVTNPGQIKPFGHRDTAMAFADPIVLDVIANDYDFNNDVLDVRILDTVSFQGGTISLSQGTGPGGRDELIYTPPENFSGEDFFHYTVVDETGRTDFGAVNVTVENPEITVDLTENLFTYDAGTLDSPLFSNANGVATRLSPATNGDVFWSLPVSAADQGPLAGVNNFNRDYIEGTAATTLSHVVENGIWRVTVNMSDPTAGLDNQFVRAEGETRIADLDSPVGTNVTTSFNVTVLDGQLDLEFGDSDVVDPRWAVNRVVLQQIEAFTAPVLQGDFNNDEIVDVADFTVWRDALGDAANPFTGADASGNGVVDVDDYQIWRENFGERIVATPLIDATTGNGEFAIDSTVGVEPIGPVNDPSIVLSRDRALVQNSIDDRGIAVPGWRIIRVDYGGSNPAIGVDGNFGFAPDAGQGPGETGQVFVNSGAITVTSDTVSRQFFVGDEIELSYLVGSDANNATATVQATATLTLDEGLPTQRVETFPLRSGTGLDTPAFVENYTVPVAASTVSVSFLLDGVAVGRRALLDSVELTVKSSSTNAAAIAGTARVATGPVVTQAATVDSESTAATPVAQEAAPSRVSLPILFRSAPARAAYTPPVRSVLSSASSDQVTLQRGQALLEIYADQPVDPTTPVAYDALTESEVDEQIDSSDTAFEEFGGGGLL